MSRDSIPENDKSHLDNSLNLQSLLPRQISLSSGYNLNK